MIESPTLLSSDATDYTDYAVDDVLGGKYCLKRFLGEGSQGSVWLAENLALRAEVAIKIVHGEPANPAPTLRLEQEARAAAQIGHPAVVRVFDLGRTTSGDAFIVMESLVGENLGERLATKGRLSPVEAVRTLLPIADVLHVAHARGIVHRDIKPENVFLAKSGSGMQPKLLDFGIAKLRRDREKADPVITDVGALVGSPAYVSPEQAFCRADVGQPADIWSFCVVLYECLTGTVPFDADDYRELFRQIGEAAPLPILAHGVGDFELWEILRRGLAKEPAQRWPDMQSLGRALAAWLKARGIQDDITGIRLDARWLAKGRTEPVPVRGQDSFDPPSFIRRITHVAVAPKPAPARRVSATTRRLVMGGVLAGSIPLIFYYSLVAPRSLERAAAQNASNADAKLEPREILRPPGEPLDPLVPAELAPIAAKTVTPDSPPPPGPTPAATQALPEPSPAASPAPASSAASLAPASPAIARPKKRDRGSDSDLLDPY